MLAVAEDAFRGRYDRKSRPGNWEREPIMLALYRGVVTVTLLALLSAGSWFGYEFLYKHERELRERDDKITEQAEVIGGLEQDLEQKEQVIREKEETIQRLDLANRLLKVDRRMAHVVVIDQTDGEEGQPGTTKFKFVEVDAEGNPLGEAEVITIEGDLLYVDAWVVKFDDLFVEQNDPLRSASLCLFRRLFGEHEAPVNGVVLDDPAGRPEAYGGAGATEFEAKIWDEFWEYANDPKKAEQMGIRAAHGEAPSMKLKKGHLYRLTLRASDGLTFEPEKIPAGISE